MSRRRRRRRPMFVAAHKLFWAGRVQVGGFEAVAMVSLCCSLQWALAAIRGRAFRAKELRRRAAAPTGSFC